MSEPVSSTVVGSSPANSESEAAGSSPSTSPYSLGRSVVTNFRVRSRFMTEETIRIQNIPHLTMTQSNPFNSQDEDDDLVSSVSSDSRNRINPNYSAEHQASLPAHPPKEITIPQAGRAETECPEWMTDVRDCKPRVIRTISGKLPRPRLNRHCSAPTYSISPKPIPTENTIPDSSYSLNGESFWSSETQSLLGNRPRRRHVRNLSTPISVGSVVGQSSLKTSQTLITSCSVSEHSFNHTRAARKRLNDLVVSDMHARPRQSVIKRELQYMFHAVSSPLRRIKQNRQKTGLKRSAKGCLT